jgi:hypothetical protein
MVHQPQAEIVSEFLVQRDWVGEETSQENMTKKMDKGIVDIGI